jgi:hypothetical protein
MQDPAQEGGCRCGQVRFRVSGCPVMTMACHCAGCQRMTSSAFSLSALFPSDAFEVTSGTPVIGGLHGANRHFFCPYCMSWMFTRPERMEAFVNVRPTMLDDATSFTPFLETYTIDKLPWAATPAVHSFERYPPMEEFPALLAEYVQSSR